MKWAVKKNESTKEFHEELATRLAVSTVPPMTTSLTVSEIAPVPIPRPPEKMFLTRSIVKYVSLNACEAERGETERWEDSEDSARSHGGLIYWGAVGIEVGKRP